jgi:hypothetical protein
MVVVLAVGLVLGLGPGLGLGRDIVDVLFDYTYFEVRVVED